MGGLWFGLKRHVGALFLAVQTPTLNNVFEVRPVSPTEMAARISDVVNELVRAASVVFLPLAGACLLVSIIALLLGWAFHSSTARKIGLGGITGVFVGLLLFFLIPYVLGLLAYIGTKVKL